MFDDSRLQSKLPGIAGDPSIELNCPLHTYRRAVVAHVIPSKQQMADASDYAEGSQQLIRDRPLCTFFASHVFNFKWVTFNILLTAQFFVPDTNNICRPAYFPL